MGRGLTTRRSRATRLAVAVLALAATVLMSSSAGASSTATAGAPEIHQLLLRNALPGGRAAAARGAGRAGQGCGETPGLICTRVDVPLDRTGAVPGTISLHVEVLPAEGTPRGAVFLIAGGPGQGSAHVFGLGAPGTAALFHFLFPGYTLVAYDDRGTGDSGLIDCPALQTAVSASAQRAAAAQCANIIGPNRTFYSTGAHAEDLEAVRASIGVDKVALYGISYGTKLALAYALAHPDHVERLILDSVLPTALPDPFGADTLRAMPAALNGFCSDGSCRAATTNLAADVATVANRLAAKPLQGKVLLPSGATTTERLEGLTFLSIVLDADLSPGLASELPAVVHAARVGNTQPLLRLAKIHETTFALSSIELSVGLNAATTCSDGLFPWPPNTPPAERRALFNAAVAALPAGSLGPFGNWAAAFGIADFCLDWPAPAGQAPLGPGPLPNVPVLAISGGFDMRTPTAGAASVVSLFPQGTLLVVPGVGHDPSDADPSGCAPLALRAWILGGAIPAQCPRPKPFLKPIPAFPAPGSATPSHPNGPLATYSIASKTLLEAEATWLTAAPQSVAGVFGGKLVASNRGFTLTRYSIARGVTLSGRIKLAKTDLPITFQGTVTVSGPAASTGILGLTGNSLRGTLGGRVVGR